MPDSFTHLHVHTEFSMLDGAARLDELVAKAVADGQPAIGMTDHGNMYGTLDFYKECNKQGIKPIIGTEAYMAHDHRSERPTRRGRIDDSGGDTEGGAKLYYHLTLLAENQTGYKNLIQLSSLAFMEGYYYKPRVDWELLEKYSEGLIATTGCLGGHVLQSLLNGDDKGALAKASRLQDIFGRDNLFVELQDHGLAAQRETNPKLVEIAKQIGAPLLATNDSHYTHQHDHESHEALLCVQTGALLSDPKRFKFEGTEHYLKTAAEMRYLFREVPTACDNSLWIAERAELEIEFGKPLLPNFPLPAGFEDDAAYLTHLTWAGAKERWGDDLSPDVAERLAYELKVICDMGFASYFLITWDLIKYAKDRGIRVGPGRGSAAGCAVAYSLRITDLDPVRYDLLFERFLNPSRISMPDIDMDFDSRYRDEMIRYAAERYGRDHVAQIITFGTIKARNAVRDAARVLGYPYGVGDKLAKAMPPMVMGRDTPLKYCFEQSTKYADGYKAAGDLRAMYDSDPDLKRIIDVARGLEGLKRSDGIHAAAVVITKEPVTDYVPIQRKPESGQDPADAPVVTQYEMHGIEDLGLLKMDFLGLRNLDVITDTVAMVRATRDPNFLVEEISLEDSATFALLSRGDTMGVFQLESPPMRQLLKALAPTSFEDVAALIALYRPGPMGVNMHYDYADRKNNRKPVEYFHEDAEEVLGDTYGLMIYQESVMRVAQKFAGYNLAEADNLRKACGKKIREMMAKERDAFEAGVVKTGYGELLGKQLFDIIEKFADYAFAKSHSFGYGLVTYQTAYLKAHYPVEYLACLLTSVKSNLDKAATYLADCRSMGIKVLPPDVNRSVSNFAALSASEVPDDVSLPVGSPGAITFGLSAVRNVGEGLVELLVNERVENGQFSSFHDFVERVPEPVLNKRTVESLIKGGAFDSLGHPRRGLLTVFEHIIDSTVSRRREREKGVMSLFGDWGDDSGTDDSSDESDGGFSERTAIPGLVFDKTDQLRFEKEMLGLYVSDHPLFGVEASLRRKVEHQLIDLPMMDDGANVVVGGIITNLARKFTKRGDQMAVFILEDLDASIEVTIFPRTLTEQGHKLEDDLIITVKGRLDRRDESRFGLIGQTVTVLTGLTDGPAPALRLKLPSTTLDELRIQRLKRILRENPGDSLVMVDIGQGRVLKLSDEFRVDLDRSVGELRMAFGHEAVLLSTPTTLVRRSIPSIVMEVDERAEMWAEQLRATLATLEAVIADRSVLDVLPVAERNRLLAAAGDVFNPDADARRRHGKEQRRREKADKVAREQAVLARTGIREGRRRPVFHSPNVYAPAFRSGLELGSADTDSPPTDARPTERNDARHCYVCKQHYTEVHHFYDQLCVSCGDLNFVKRTETADLRGRTALLTGGRVKIGYQAGLKLLRAGAGIVVTTRFPRDAAMRFAREPDFEDWSDRVEVYGLDLRHTPSVEAFCARLADTHDRLDYIVNNACQTVRRPPEFYRHMLDLETASASAMPDRARRLLGDYSGVRATDLVQTGRPIGATGITHSAELSQLRLLGDDGQHAEGLFPDGRLDQDLQQVDLRGRNSWRLMLDEVSSVELLETQLVNAVAPFVLNGRLKHLLVRAGGPTHIVNVSAMEGQFYRRFKTTRHPHTNMAKAALNMMTRTSAADYVADGIHMNSVDTGWVTDEDPADLAARKTEEHRFHPPLDIVDGAARIVDPIIDGVNTGVHVWGSFLKDYRPTDW